MTRMNAVAFSVLNMLKTQSPEVLYEKYHRELLETWSDNNEFVVSTDQFRSAFRRLEFLTSLYDIAWSLTQHQKIYHLLLHNPEHFKKQRAPEGTEQWEFDLLNIN